MHTRVYRTYNSGRKPKKKRSTPRLVSGLLILLAGIYLGLIMFVSPANAISGTTSFSTQDTRNAAVDIDWPTHGQAAIGAVGYGVLARHKTTKPIATASIAKTITALSVLQKKPFAPGETGPTITITQRDVDSFNWYLRNHGSLINVRVGQKLTQRQAFEALLLRSANNMADTLAIWAFGSLKNYQTFANNYVQQLGLAETTVGTDASGFNPSTKSTADDLVKLGELVITNPTLSEIVGQKTAQIPEVGTIYNTNNLLGTAGIIGIKTGNNDQDKGAFLFAATYRADTTHTVTILGAVMGETSIDAAKQQALQMLISAQDGFGTRKIFAKGDVLGQYTLPWSGETVDAVATKRVSVFGWKGRALHLEVNLEDISGPKEAGARVGTITVGTGGQKRTVGTVSLEESIDQPSLWWRLTHPLASLRPQNT